MHDEVKKDEKINLGEWKVGSTFAEVDPPNELAKVSFGVLVNRKSRYYVADWPNGIFLCYVLGCSPPPFRCPG